MPKVKWQSTLKGVFLVEAQAADVEVTESNFREDWSYCTILIIILVGRLAHPHHLLYVSRLLGVEQLSQYNKLYYGISQIQQLAHDVEENQVTAESVGARKVLISLVNQWIN